MLEAVTVAMTTRSTWPSQPMPRVTSPRRSQSQNQLLPSPGLASLKLEQKTPTPSRRSSLTVVPPTELTEQLHVRTRRGSVILHATIRAMSLSAAPRRKSNQDGDSDSEDESKPPALLSPHANNNEPSKPPYFRLATFMLEDHDSTPPVSPPSCPRAPRSKASHMDALFREIWTTEQSYVAALRGLVVQFFEPLQLFAKQHTIELGAVAALHHSTSTILSIHEELLRQLAPPPPPPSEDPFGLGFSGTLARLHQLSHAFLSTIEYMKVYAFYCGSYLAAKQELERLQRAHPRLAVFTAELSETARRGSQEDEQDLVPPLDINSALIKPVQRICRYPLLFRNLLATASSPEETLVVQQSLQKIEAVSTYVNEKVRESQQNARLYQLHQMLHPASGLELLQPGRTLLHEAWATVTSLDAPRWATKLLRHLRRRRRHARRTSLPRDEWCRLSVFGDDRRSSATTTLPQPADRHTSFSTASTTTQCTPRLLQRRRSSGGERVRLILLSDMLLMAKSKDQKLKIRRQICLSCAVVQDDVPATATPSPPPPYSNFHDDLLPPLGSNASPDDVSDSCGFMLEVAKVGRCSCHHFSPLTLKRSPRLGSLSTLLGRRGSLSGSEPAERRRVSKAGSRFRVLEQLAGLRAVKRYRVACDSPQDKIRLLRALRQAIARSARLVSLGSSGSELALTPSTGAKAVAMAVSLPVKIWRTIRPSREATQQQSSCREGVGSESNGSRSVLSCDRREADLLELGDACM